MGGASLSFYSCPTDGLSCPLFLPKKQMVRLISKYLSTYGYDSIPDFLQSVAPSFKYGLQIPAISFSAIAAFVTQWLGLSPFLAVAMLVAIATEMRTGIRASRRQGIPFESFRFSRCIIKLSIWLAIIYIVHAFYKECLLQEEFLYNKIGSLFFSVVKFFVMTWFCVEHLTSILENLAVIDGKPKDELISKVSDLWKEVTNQVKKKKHEENS